MDKLAALGLEPKDLILHLINAGVLFAIVRFLLYKPTRKFMYARRERITAALEEAEQAKLKVASVQEDCARLLAETEEAARDRAMEITDAAGESAKALEAHAREEARAIVEQARQETRKEHDKAMEGLRGEVIDLAAGMAEQLLKEALPGGEA